MQQEHISVEKSFCDRVREEMISGSKADKVTVECSNSAGEFSQSEHKDPRNSFAKKAGLPLPGKKIKA